jgi:hypothetical protein
MSPRRKKTGTQILKEWIRNIKRNSGKKNKTRSNDNNYMHHHQNNNSGLDGSYYLNH